LTYPFSGDLQEPEMSIARQIGNLQTSLERSERTEEFIGCVRQLMLARDGEFRGAERMGRDAGMSERQVSFLRAATTAITTVDAPALAPHPLAAAFLASLVGRSVFETMLGSMLQVPFRTSVASVTATVTGATVAEASVKPVSRLSVAAADLDPTKAVALIAVSAELLKHGGALAETLLRRELGNAIIRAIDAVFIPLLTVGAASFASSGSTAVAVAQDIRTLLQNITTGSDSRLFLITTPTITKAWATISDASGAPALATARWDGGEVAGIPVLSSDQAVSGEIVLVDASAVAAAVGNLVLDSSTNATVQMDNLGDSPPTAGTITTSFWQQDLVGLRAERMFAAKLLKTDRAARVTGASYSGNSPA
jgi:HK97 family phage major capsid protein